MAGQRQHILPRFLLRGFRSRTSGDQTYTWVQRKGEPPFESNILNVSVGRKFYEGSQEDVDEDITTLENRFAPIIERLRQESSSRTISLSEIPEFIVHLLIRTKNLRDSFLDASHFLFMGLMAHLENPEHLRALVRRTVLQKPKWFREAVEQERKKSGLSRNQLERHYPNLERQIFAQFENTLEESTSFIAALRESVKSRLEEAIKDGHLKALAKTLVPESRLKGYQNYKWHLLVLDAPNLILGDAGPIHQVGQDFKALPDKDDIIVSIYLPIGERHLLAGSLSHSIPSVDPGLVNTGQATCAREYIVGPSHATVERYKNVIGLRGFILSDDDLGKILQAFLSEL